MFTNTKPKPVENNLPTPLEKIAESFSKKMNTANSRLIVLTFTNADGKEHKLGNIFAEKLTTDLVRKGSFVVLDRLVYAKKLNENQLDLASGTDLSELKRIGEVLGLNLVVTGILTGYNSGFGINCRLIDPKTGLILSAEEAFYGSE